MPTAPQPPQRPPADQAAAGGPPDPDPAPAPAPAPRAGAGPAPTASAFPQWAKVALVCLAVAVAMLLCGIAGLIVLVRPGASGPLDTMLTVGGFLVAAAALVVACARRQQ
ncbi:hypothetical protein [Streptomyces sp. NBC_00102]|uniref:hypothetical protein n=1 Tax=Streptomyces sp. NBC_00102 TaxID=2975652 RepID=UPI00225B982F|nr:hypothetical protein [Streptomyces sp. NBC_00102]MCX5401990.1 hypothetical protein [Streptomyces sp. NBC_00102]